MTTSRPRARLVWTLAVAPRLPSLSDSARFVFDMRSAGARPKAIPVTSETSAVKARTRASISVSATRVSDSGLSATIRSVPQNASIDPQHAAEAGQQHALRQELADDARAARAERQPHLDLTLPADGAFEQQVGDVHAGDEQHERDGTQQQQERGPQIARPSIRAAA